MGEGYNAIAISGCTDSQTSGDTGHGGILTHSMLMAIQELNQGHDRAIQSQGYSLGSLMRAIIEKDDETFHSKQTINIHVAPGTDCETVSWPCIPPPTYHAPWRSSHRRVRELPIQESYGGGTMEAMRVDQPASDMEHS